MSRTLDSELVSLVSLAGLVKSYGHRNLGKRLAQLAMGFVEDEDYDDEVVITAERAVVIPTGLLQLYASLEKDLFTTKAVLLMTVDLNPTGPGLLALLYNHGRKSAACWREALSAFHCADVCVKQQLEAKAINRCDLFEEGWWGSVLSMRAAFSEEMISFLRKQSPQIEKYITPADIAGVFLHKEETVKATPNNWQEWFCRGASFDLDVPMYAIKIMLDRGWFDDSRRISPSQLSASLSWLRLGEAMARYITFAE